jgi:antiphage defense system Thoeris ThsB-like protein
MNVSGTFSWLNRGTKKARSKFIDLSVKEAYETDWKERVRTRIRRSHGVIALISKNSLNSSGQKWEIKCAIEEKRPLLGVWAYKTDRNSPSEMNGQTVVEWAWDTIQSFLDKL